MWREIFRMAAAIELGLVGLEHGLHPAWLPLGGGHVEQIAVLFIAAFVLLEGAEALKALKKEIQ
ncbi:MAG: hypothetical protein IPG57_24890 [Burkholderiales bacterium]|jgi:hypothetical protein|nr:hypothetical protein [Burkholderiales bacterium]